MKKLTKSDLEDVTLLMEELVTRLPEMKREERIDVAARIRGVAKHAEFILESVKAEVKKVRKHKEGTVLGEQWRAQLKLIPVQRLDQKALKEQLPKVHADFMRSCENERVTFEVR